MTLDLTGLTEKRNRAGTRYYEDEKGEIIAKQCTACSDVVSIARFRVEKSGLAGKQAKCKECKAGQDRKYREDNVEYYREYREDNVKYYREYSRKYREDNADYYLKYREDNADKISEYQRKYREENADKIREMERKYREENAERIRKYREENADYYRKYREANRVLYKAIDLRRRARKRVLPDTFTESDLTEISLHFDGRCVITGDTDVHMDHVLPISIGHGGTTYENMIPIREDLNMSKHNRNIFEWFADNRERFDLSQAKFDELVEYLAGTNEMTTKEYRDFVYWCHDNPRTVEEIEADNERYGYMKPSSEIWREEVANKGRELVEA